MGRSEEKQAKIIEAALSQFAHYGYRRTSMEDIAQSVGVSRPALYLHFKNKEAIFLAVAGHLHEEGLAKARVALAEKGSAEQRVWRAFEVWSVEYIESVYQMPHGAELVDVNSRLASSIYQSAQSNMEAMLATVIAEGDAAGDLDLAAASVSSSDVAALLVRSARGLKYTAEAPALYRERLRRLVRLIFRSLRPA